MSIKKRLFIGAAAAAMLVTAGVGAANAQPSGSSKIDQQATVLQAAGIKDAPQPALVTVPTGTITDRQYFATQDAAFVVPAATPSGTWVSVPGIVRTISIAAGTSRLIEVNFTAEVQCAGGSWCSARAVVVNSLGGMVELDPASGLDYAFASPGGSTWDGHAMSRVSRTFFGPGTYRVLVQVAEVGAVSTYRVDEGFMKVGLIRP